MSVKLVFLFPLPLTRCLAAEQASPPAEEGGREWDQRASPPSPPRPPPEASNRCSARAIAAALQAARAACEVL